MRISPDTLRSLAQRAEEQAVGVAATVLGGAEHPINENQKIWHANNLFQLAATLSYKANRIDDLARHRTALRAIKSHFEDNVEAALKAANFDAWTYGIGESHDEHRQDGIAKIPDAKRNQDMVDMIERVLDGGSVEA